MQSVAISKMYMSYNLLKLLFGDVEDGIFNILENGIPPIFAPD